MFLIGLDLDVKICYSRRFSSTRLLQFASEFLKKAAGSSKPVLRSKAPARPPKSPWEIAFIVLVGQKSHGSDASVYKDSEVA